MASERTERFMRALQDAERTGDVGGLSALFAGDAELSKLARPDPHRGPAGARAFWGEYLAAFDGIRSTFTNVIEGPDASVLEWTSEGRLPGGQPIAYRGVSVLGWRGDEVAYFRTYYDSAAFVAGGTASGTSGRG